MGLAPAEFYRLQYSELRLLLEGRATRQRREWKARREESAWVVSWLMQPYKSKDAPPEVLSQAWLLGRQRKPKFSSDEEAARAYMAALNAQSKKGGVSNVE